MGQRLHKQTVQRRLTMGIILSLNHEAIRELNPRSKFKFNDSPVSLHSLLFCQQLIKNHINNLQKGEFTKMFLKGLPKGQGQQGHQHAVWQICLCLAVFVFFTGQVSAFVVGNGVEKIKDKDDSTTTNSGTSTTGASTSTTAEKKTDTRNAELQDKPLGQYVAEAAGLFLQSKSLCLQFLNAYEMSGIKGVDFEELQNYLDNSITKLEHARQLYIDLQCIANQLPYNENVLTQLYEFDYSRYAKEHRLVIPIFDQVKDYLEVGDVDSIFDRFIENTEGILRIAYIAKSDVENGILPKLDTIWDLSERYTTSFLFGQYVARVFMNLAP